MTDVVFISNGDWANMGSHLAESLRRVGVSAESFAGWHLRMDYPIKSTVYKGWEQVLPKIKAAKVVWLMHGQVFKHREIPLTSDQVICAFHGGPPLLQMRKGGGVKREFFGRYHRRHWDMVHFIQHPKLFDDCSFLKRKYLLSPPVDTDILQPVYFNGDKNLAVGHFPRNTGSGLKTKGCDKVERVFESLQKLYPKRHVEINFIPWNKHIARVIKCDVYVEKLSEILLEWGMSALEAAALGKIVISQFTHREVYEKRYGPSPIYNAYTESDLYDVLTELSKYSKEEIREKQKETRAWAVKYHSFEAVGRRLRAILLQEGAKI